MTKLKTKVNRMAKMKKGIVALLAFLIFTQKCGPYNYVVGSRSVQRSVATDVGIGPVDRGFAVPALHLGT